MPTKNPRLAAVVEKPLVVWLKKRAKKQGISVSLVVRDILREAYEQEEDIYWSKEAAKREKTFKRAEAVSHKQAWGKGG